MLLFGLIDKTNAKRHTDAFSHFRTRKYIQFKPTRTRDDCKNDKVLENRAKNNIIISYDGTRTREEQLFCYKNIGDAIDVVRFEFA